jgi:TonB-dependent receptor
MAVLAITTASPAQAQIAPAGPQDPPITAPAAQPQQTDQQQPATTAASPADQGQDIVVTGFRQSLASAIQIKKQSTGVVDAINAQDIADFPDANLADSLQRIPGISIERDGGEGRTVTVRGLGGDFSRTRFNGLEAISATTGSTLGAGVNRGRSFDYSVFASELFNSIVVRKTQSAEVDEGSLGATIDLQTGRPFDNPGFQAALSGQAAYYDINQSVAPRLVGLISKTFANDRFGILLSAAYNKRTTQEDAYSNTALTDFSDLNNGFCPVVPNTPTRPVNALIGSSTRTSPCIPASGATPGSTQAAYDTINQPNVFVPRLPGYGRFINRQERLGLTGTIQAKPTDTSIITLDLAFSRYKQDKNDLATNPISLNRGAGVAAAGLTAAQLTGRPNMKVREAVVENGQLVYGVFDGTDFSVTNSHDISTTTFYQADLHIEQEVGDRGKASLLYGQSDSVLDNPYSRLVTFSRFDGNGFIYDARGANKNTPVLNYGFDAANPANWQYQNGYDNIREFTSKVTNRLRNLKLDFKYDLTDELTGKIGIAAKRFTFISARQQRIAGTTNIPTLASAGLSIADVSLPPITIDTIGIPNGASNRFIVPDIDRIMRAFNVDCYCVNQYGDFRIGSIGTGAQGDNRGVTEQDISPYVQLDFKIPLGEMTLRGDAGVRYAHTHQQSQGYVGTGTLVRATRDYDDWLPALNMALDITQKLTLRASTARVMSRPSLGFLTPGGSIGTAQAPFTATIGNPQLNPYRATNIDAAVEWYLQPGAVLSAGFFQKNIASFVQQITSTSTYAAAGLPLGLLLSTQDPNTTTNITSYVNTNGGRIRGLELQYQQPFTFLPGFLSNFGTILNYTHIKSNITYILTTNASGPSLVAPLVNVSPNAANATVYYEDSRLSARVSLAYRDEYVRQVPLRSGLADYTGSYATTNVDASLSYKFSDAVTLSLDAINLTNQATSFWDGVGLRDQQVFSKTGRQFFAGARFKF